MAVHGELHDRLRANCARFDRVERQRSELRAAAVACVLVRLDSGPGFVITRRSPRTPAHPGQWALPGGRVHEGESVEVTARRELAEETGLEVGPEAVLGLLDDYVSRSGHLITPVVVWAGPHPSFDPDPREVSELVVVEFETLDRPDVPRLVAIPESDRPVIQLPLRDTFVHAPTAAILHQFHQVVVRGVDCRVDGYEEPVFAWR